MDFLAPYYPWLKTAHIISVISWMAGMFYLPRLFVHHAEQAKVGTDSDSLLRMMEDKLLRIIMRPAMMSTWLFGILLASIPGVIDWAAVWPWAKLVSIIAMTAVHIWLSKQQKAFAAGENTLSGRTYRIMNEAPTVLMLVIVIAVVVRPF